jgi:hypothetical protein
MGRRARMTLTLVAATVVALFVSAASASASFHLMKIRALFEGNSATTGTIELQMTADGQNLVGGHKLCVFANVGFLCSAISIPSNVANGGNQRTVLLSDNAALSPDVPTGGLINTLLSGTNPGALCYENIDCVSWGAFTNNANLPSPAGTPLSGLSSFQVVSRTIARGCPTALDDPDDTNDSAADFSFGVGFPFRNNAGAPTETLCPAAAPPGNPTSPVNPAGNIRKRKCKKAKKKSSGGSTGAYAAKKKKCKKRK